LDQLLKFRHFSKIKYSIVRITWKN